MLTIETMKKIKEEKRFSCSDLSKLSGVPLGTVQKVFSGATKEPRRETLLKLSDVLEKEMSGGVCSQFQSTSGKSGTEDKGVYTLPGSSMLKEAAPVYGSLAGEVTESFFGKRQGEYTVEDYLALPDDERYELIDGVLYSMASPTSNHQEIAGYLYYKIMECIEEHDAPCRPYIAPLDVQLDKDNRTMLQPDVIINCDPERNIGPRLFGAPDFVAEVMSPSSRIRDQIIKLNKYYNAKVKEYWVLNPKSRKVTVYRFEPEYDTSEYDFSDDIPIGISNGKCTVSLKGILKWLL